VIADVHTTGVNIESAVTIIGSVTGVLAIVGGWINSKIEKHRKATAHQISQVAEALTGRLDRFDTHLDEQDRNLQSVSVRVARLEGPLSRASTSIDAINNAVNGAAAGERSIRQNVEALVDRRDLDPDLPHGEEDQ
jgi:methyl-accepting chemotaxis protein